MPLDTKDYLNKNVQVIMDRPLGSKHPKHGFEYLTNYGYIPGTISGDGEELDAYFLGVDKPLAKFQGTCIAIIHRTNDDDDKLIVVDESSKKTLHYFEQLWNQPGFNRNLTAYKRLCSLYEDTGQYEKVIEVANQYFDSKAKRTKSSHN